MDSTTTIGAVMITLAVLIGFGIMFVILTSLRSHKLVVRSPDSNRIEGFYKILPKKDKATGIIWWKSVFWQKKITLPEPPDEVIFINPKGKIWVEVYRLSDSEYIYIQDKGLKDNSIIESSQLKVSETLKPFSEVQRQVIVNQFAKAEAQRQHSFLRENGMNIAALGMMMMIIVIGIVYWGDIASATMKQNDATTGLLGEANKLVKGLAGDVRDVAPAGGSNAVVQRGTEKPPK